MPNLRWQELLILVTILSLIALFVWLIVWVATRMGTTSQQQGLVKCPYCAEAIQPEARVCKHCGRDVSPAAGVPPG